MSMVARLLQRFGSIKEPKTMEPNRPEGEERLIELDYPIRPLPRYGYDRPPHRRLSNLIAGRTAIYERELDTIATLSRHLQAIPLEADVPPGPRWLNDFFPPLDAATLYGIVAQRRPRLYVEIGSGESTCFARRAIVDHQLETKIISIDPHPRAGIDSLCDELLRVPMEDLEPQWFARLGPGDVLFLDGSHRVLQNSDVVATFLDIVPELPAGVVFGVHDVYLPYDYPPEWRHRYYSEQYLLATHLLAGGRLAPILPNYVITHTPSLRERLSDIWSGPLSTLTVHGEAFWLEVESLPSHSTAVPRIE